MFAARNRPSNGLQWMLMFGALFLFSAPSPLHAVACVDATKLPGVSSDCKQTAGASDLDTTGSTYWTEEKLLKEPFVCSSPMVCMFTKGSQLCTALAKYAKQDGAFVCARPADCTGKALAESVPAADQTCPVGQSCCIGTAAPAAGGAAKPTVKTLPDPLGGVNITVIIGSVIRAFAGIAGSIALVMFVWGGISMILSQGESGKVQKARQTLINSAIGIVLIFGAFTFVSAIIDAILARTSGG